MVLAMVGAQGVMRQESDLKRLKRQLAKAKALVQQTAIKVEDLEASVEETYRFSERVVVFPRPPIGKRPVRAARTDSVGDFLLT
jgi:hypothetical protein